MFKNVVLLICIHLSFIFYCYAEDSAANDKNNGKEVLPVEENNKPDNNEDLNNSERFYTINIKLKIFDDEKKELVNSSWSLKTFSGKPVSINLKGKDLLIKADMTPYYSDKKSVLLLTQANVKMKPANSEAGKFYSTVNSLPIKLGEKALFFPLGLLDEKMENISSCILEIEVLPYDNSGSINGPESGQLEDNTKKK